MSRPIPVHETMAYYYWENYIQEMKVRYNPSSIPLEQRILVCQRIAEKEKIPSIARDDGDFPYL